MSVHPSPIELFISYAHKDEVLKEELVKYLKNLQQQGIITGWHDRLIRPGQNWSIEIDIHLNSASLILLLISIDFMASQYCYGIEMRRALERNANGNARVIPIILRPTDLKGAPFAHLQALPQNAKPITSWAQQDEAFVNTIAGIRAVIEELQEIPPQRTNLSSINNLPFERNYLFTGREEILQDIYTSLHTDQFTALTQMISGLGGIGKTQTALEYAYRYQDEYDSIFWVTAETYERTLSDLNAIAHRLHLPEQDQRDGTAVVNSIKSWLQTHTRWLLILDNADDVTLITNILPIRHQGHILMTTRSHITGRVAHRTEIKQMELEQGALFLLKRAMTLNINDTLKEASQEEQRLARAITDELGGLPLALDQAGAYIEETRCGLQGYLTLYQQRNLDLLNHRGKLIADHPNPVATTWSLSFEKVQQNNPIATEILHLCAFFDADAIPEELFTISAAKLGPILKPLIRASWHFDQAISDLLDYSLVIRNANHTLSMHRLVQVIVRENIRKSDQKKYIERIIKAFAPLLPPPEQAHWQKCLFFFPQALHCTNLILKWHITFTEANIMLRWVALIFNRQAQYHLAEPLFQQVLTITEQTLGSDHLDTASALNNLAELYRYQGKYHLAEPLLQRALSIDEQSLSPDHPETASTLNNLANLDLSQGNFDLAESPLLRALSIREQTLGPNNSATGSSLNNLGLLYLKQNKFNLAEPLLQRALSIHEQTLSSTATNLHNLAVLYLNQNKFDLAESLFQSTQPGSDNQKNPINQQSNFTPPESGKRDEPQ